MSILKPVDYMREPYVGLGSAPEYNKRAHTHLLIVWLGLENRLLLDAQHAFGTRRAILVGGYAFVRATVGHRGTAQKKRAIETNGEATAGNELIILAPEDLWPGRTKRDALNLDRLALDNLGLVVWRLLDLGRLRQHVQIEVSPGVAVLVGHVTGEHARVMNLNVGYLHDLVVNAHAWMSFQELTLYGLAIDIPVDFVGRRATICVARERNVLADTHVLILGLVDPVRLRLDYDLNGRQGHAELVAAAALVGARIGELYGANNELLALGISRVAAVGGQNAVDLAPEHLRCGPTTEDAFESHL